MIKDVLPLNEVLRRTAAQTPGKPYIKFEGRKFTFKDIDGLAL